MFRKGFGPVVRALARRYARHAVREDGELLRHLEGRFRHGAGACAHAQLQGQRLPTLLTLAERIDSEEFIEALRRGHYQELRRRPHPVLRNYEFRGVHVTHDIRNKSQWNAFARGVHQPGVTHWLRTFATPGACTLDVGANAGVLSLEMAQAVGRAGIVHAFEPNPEAFELLAGAIEAGSGITASIRLHRFGLGTEDRTMTLAVPPANNGAASLRDPRPGERTIDVEVRSFDSWWRAEGEPRIDVVKLDVEGFEATVVSALMPMLERDRPVLVMELSPARYDGAALLDRLAQLGYRFKKITSCPPYATSLPGTPSQQTDIVCFPQAVREG